MSLPRDSICGWLAHLTRAQRLIPIFPFSSPYPQEQVIVAIDGPAGSGKSTTAREVARRLGFLFINTGAMYRAVGLAFLENNKEATEASAQELLPTIQINLKPDGEGLRVFLNSRDVTALLSDPEVARMASQVARLPQVREKLVQEQRRLGYAARPGAVLEGRDIGSVVFPDAQVKVFMVADPVVRARRRYAELEAKGIETSVEEILADISKRDQQDAERALSPLVRAQDAHLLDSTNRSIEQQVQFVLDLVRERGMDAMV